MWSNNFFKGIALLTGFLYFTALIPACALKANRPAETTETIREFSKANALAMKGPIRGKITPWTKKWWVRTIAVVVIGGAVAAFCCNGGDDNGGGEQNGSAMITGHFE